MGLDALNDIWAEDEESKPEPRKKYSSDLVGIIASTGYDKANNKGLMFDTFRVTTSGRDTADAVAQLYGGAPVEDPDAKGEFFTVVDTDRDKLYLVVNGTESVSFDMKKWENGVLTHWCTGRYYLDEDRKGTRCDCPKFFAERKARGKKGIGPKPDIRVRGPFADDTELGMVEFRTKNWGVLERLHETGAALDAIDGPALVEIEIEHVEYDIEKGPDAGQHRSFRVPHINVKKAYDDAITDAPELDA